MLLAATQVATFILFLILFSAAAVGFRLDIEEQQLTDNILIVRPDVAESHSSHHGPSYKTSDATTTEPPRKKKFHVDYERGVFVKDGQPFRYVSGSMHYQRVPPEYWRDRLRRMAALGLDAVQTYVPWNIHEPWPGVYNFSGSRDLFKFIRTAQSEGLLVLLRVGPYICGEWDAGGLPPWLWMDNPAMNVRTNDPEYLKHVRRYWGVLLPKLVPYLYENGGPIIMVQVENEYGSFPRAEPEHMVELLNIAKLYFGEDVVYYTTDGSPTGYFAHGRVDGALTTVDFGPNDDPAGSFQDLQNFFKNYSGPYVNSEFYSGWFSHWGEPFQRFSPEKFAQHLDLYLKSNNSAFSVNMYMLHGGTSFGFYPGANSNSDGSSYMSDPNSYDYDSPLTENGGCGLKCQLVREVLLKYTSNSSLPEMPANISSFAYGMVQMDYVDSLLNLKTELISGEPKTSPWPSTFDKLCLDYGFVLYEAQPLRDYLNVTLEVVSLADEAVVLVDGNKTGILSRQRQIFKLNEFSIRKGQTLSILVESMGRANYGGFTSDLKGMQQVTLGGDLLPHWKMFPIPLNDTGSLHDLTKRLKREKDVDFALPGFFRANVRLSRSERDPHSGFLPDTFLKLTSFTRGVAFLNGFNLGRYWNDVGPVNALYVPGPLLRMGEPNDLVVLELDVADCDVEVPGRCYVDFVESQLLIESKHLKSAPSSRIELAGAWDGLHA